METNIDFASDLLGAAFDGVKNAENADAVFSLLDRYGLNWTVSKQPLSLPDGIKTPFYGIVRDDKKTVFTTCKDSYKPFQNTELAEMLIRLSEKTGYEIHGGGLFNGGGKVFLQLESPNKIQGIGKNRTTVKGFVTGINSHDGTTSLKWGETNITICCKNTFNAAVHALKNSARHTESLQGKVEDAIRNVTGIVEQEKALFDQFIKLSEIPATRHNIASIVKGITGVDSTVSKAELEANYTTYAVNRSKELLTAIAQEIDQKGETLWGLFSGVTKYTSHVLPVPKRDNARLESIYTGSAHEINNNAFALVNKFATN